jgi:2-succinyl-5-enolpyruvyl-6-hydroxy-3-cyclohexene-1-carboxylate synthase
VIDGHLAAQTTISEPRVFSELAELLPAGASLFVANSMPVRDLDTFFGPSKTPLALLGNRGANGIDGLVSTALGAVAAGAGPMVLTLGDLALYHDANGLLAAKLHGLDLTIVLINNDGGGIFSFLPQASEQDRFELLFGTPHGLDFAPLAAMYGARYTLASDWEAFRTAVGAGVAGKGVHLVEVRTERKQNVADHRAIWPQVADALAQAGLA